MMHLLSTRWYFFLFFLACTGLLGFGLFLEHVKGLEPCPLCIFQRIAYLAIGLIALIATLHGPKKLFGQLYNLLITLFAFGGAGIAGRQIWLQHLPPDQVPECGPGLEYMLEVFPLAEALKMLLSGSGECAEVQWRFIGLSIAEWSLCCFLLFATVSLVALIYRKRAT